MSNNVLIRIDRTVAEQIRKGLKDLGSQNPATKILAYALGVALKDKSSTAFVLPESIQQFGDDLFD